MTGSRIGLFSSLWPVFFPDSLQNIRNNMIYCIKPIFHKLFKYLKIGLLIIYTTYRLRINYGNKDCRFNRQIWLKIWEKIKNLDIADWIKTEAEAGMPIMQQAAGKKTGCRDIWMWKMPCKIHRRCLSDEGVKWQSINAFNVARLWKKSMWEKRSDAHTAGIRFFTNQEQ